MGIEPGELTIVELGMQRNLVSGIFRNVEAIVRRVCGTRRNQMNVNHRACRPRIPFVDGIAVSINKRSEEHTSELQSHLNLVCRLLLEKKKKKMLAYIHTCLIQCNIDTVTCTTCETSRSYRY